LIEEYLVTHKTIFGIAILATMIAAPALAADMAVKAATGTPLATTWTGCYGRHWRQTWLSRRAAITLQEWQFRK
jgi:hypothetical protein